jgi:hypothetical protein
MSELTKEQAIELADSRFWIDMSYRDKAMFQMFEPLLCMPFNIFHEAVEKTLGRPVFTHEFGLNYEGLQQELLGNVPAPSFEEVLALIPADKRVIVLERI